MIADGWPDGQGRPAEAGGQDEVRPELSENLPAEEQDPQVLFSDPAQRYADTVMARRAAREGWNVGRADKDRIKGRLLELMDIADKPREGVRIAGAFLAMDEADRQADGGAVAHAQEGGGVTVNLVVTEGRACMAGERELLPGVPLPGMGPKRED